MKSIYLFIVFILSLTFNCLSQQRYLEKEVTMDHNTMFLKKDMHKLSGIVYNEYGEIGFCQEEKRVTYFLWIFVTLKEVEKIIRYGSKPLFSNTTPNPKNAGMRNDLDVVRLNEIALTVMKKFDVPHNDLYGFVKSQEDYPTLYMHPRAENNCHFLEHGRELLGKQVAQFVLDNM